MITNPRAARTRRIYTPEARSEYLTRFAQSGLSQAEFCRRRRIHLSTFSLWLRTAKVSAGREGSVFAEVQLVGAKVDQPSAVTLRLPNGAMLEVSAGSATMWQGLGLLLKALQS